MPLSSWSAPICLNYLKAAGPHVRARCLETEQREQATTYEKIRALAKIKSEIIRPLLIGADRHDGDEKPPVTPWCDDGLNRRKGCSRDHCRPRR